MDEVEDSTSSQCMVKASIIKCVCWRGCPYCQKKYIYTKKKDPTGMKDYNNNSTRSEKKQDYR